MSGEHVGIMAERRQAVPVDGHVAETRVRQRPGPGRSGGRQAMVPPFTGGLARAALVVALISTPALLLPGTTADTALVAAFVALVAGAFTAVEYNAAAPSLVAFRDAPPFNRMRFGALFVTVLVLSLILRGKIEETGLTRLFALVGDELARAIDFPYSPVRLVMLMLPADIAPETVAAVRVAAGLSYLVSILTLGAFVLILRLRGWPARTGRFNVWVNLPVFDPTSGDDVVDRLRHDAQINVVLGFLLPFIIPAVVKLATVVVEPADLGDAHTLIWTMTAWAFLPASLLMRGIALNRIADLILDQRRTGAEVAPLAQA